MLNQTPAPSPSKHTKPSSGPTAQQHTGHYMVPEISSSPPDKAPSWGTFWAGCDACAHTYPQAHWNGLCTSTYLVLHQLPSWDQPRGKLLMSTLPHVSCLYLHLLLLKESLPLSISQELEGAKGKRTWWHNPRRNTASCHSHSGPVLWQRTAKRT